jgi:hypothetical protein
VCSSDLAATEDRNPTMMIWLGKQMLGQDDKQKIEHAGTVGVTRIVIEAATNGDGDDKATA